MASDANGLSTDLRVLRQDEWDKWYNTLIRGFGGVPEAAEEREWPRRHQPGVHRLAHSLYVRPVEVGAALEARTYQAPVDVVFEVEDTFCPWNAGRWRLSGDAKGASCERTADAADLTLPVRELGAAYLGGVSLASLGAAGRVRELRRGALAEASLGFGAGAVPWLPHGF